MVAIQICSLKTISGRSREIEGTGIVNKDFLSYNLSLQLVRSLDALARYLPQDCFIYIPLSLVKSITNEHGT